jgi:predicted secreted protein
MAQFLLFTLLTVSAFASEHQMIDTLGVSSKGQFVALEEYGYKSQSHSYYVRIKIMNVWKKEYVGKSIEVELPAHRPVFLEKARARAKFLAIEELKHYKIDV